MISKPLNHYYKRSKIAQLKSFCAIVELGSNLTIASEKINVSISTISMQIRSLEHDLNFNLFDRNGKILSLNDKGKEYYKEAKRILLDIDEVYNGKFNIKKVSWLKIYLENRIKIYNKKISKLLKKMIIKITVKRGLAFLLITISSILLYLNNTNWLFDRKILKLSEPLLKEVIVNGIYRIPEEKICSYDSTEITYQFSNLSFKITDNDPSISQTRVQVNDCPGTAMRINDDKETAKVFYNKKEIKCDLDRRFNIMLRSHKVLTDNFDRKKNFRYYSIHKKQDCTNQHIFEENKSKYPNQIFGIYANGAKFDVGNTAINMFKKGRYYYVLILVNGSQPHYRDAKKEKYFIFRKLTLSDLMKFDNGSYWKLIKDYNIKID